MSHKLNPKILQLVRDLRDNQTSAEDFLWRILRNRQILKAKFRRQHPVTPYVLDFYCHESRLAIELDGGQHAFASKRKHDAEREQFLNEKGITVLRFWNRELFDSPESVIEAIVIALTPTLSQRERE
ncbi:endonuclease domain-containing protein [bacterium]|nr:endonuclease domain-containing protein [bacterium]